MGPATASEDAVRKLVEAGMDVARLNFSHGDYPDHEANYKRGDLVVIVAGAPPGTVGSTNLIHVHRIGEDDV